MYDRIFLATVAGLLAAFRERLRDRGWVDGQNVMIEWRCAERSAERLSTLLVPNIHERAER
jgi:hypothetical protein